MKVPIPSMAESPGTVPIASLGAAQLGRLQRSLLAWYGPRARPLRIRTATDPWAILVAEVMAQQTQIGRVDVAWVSFMQRFPSPRSMARASVGQVLRAWAGLGYNKRALALHAAARSIERDHRGRVPGDVETLLSLPGVGPYTSRAVAAVAYGVPVAAVDTNVRRVLLRLAGTTLDAAALQALADGLVAPEESATWMHATMDLGATVCRSRRPPCGECPVSEWCASAGRVAAPTRVARKPTAVPFELTTRWLRGRIVERLRAAEEGCWEHLPKAIGKHGPRPVAAAIEALEHDGLLERRADGAVRLPSATT